MYLFMVSLFLLVDTRGEKINILSPAFCGAIIPATIGFYLFYSLIFERYLSKKMLLASLGLAIICSVIATIITDSILYSLYNIDKSWQTIVFSGLLMLFIAFINGILGLVMKGFITWYKDIKIKAELDKKNYETELALMKAQLNPHFLFNTINNIDMLIQKDAGKASEYLNKLSDIMRFMLYELKTEKIPLAKEIAYIEKYVELQKIRTSNENFVKFEVQDDIRSVDIEPMLLIPFIENAFKHSENKKIPEAVRILIKADPEKLHFECVNAYSDSQKGISSGGLGNELIKRRLELLYPDKHIFEVTNAGGYYSVKLDIDLN